MNASIVNFTYLLTYFNIFCVADFYSIYYATIILSETNLQTDKKNFKSRSNQTIRATRFVHG